MSKHHIFAMRLAKVYPWRSTQTLGSNGLQPKRN
jgi:hypothetical protein